MSCVVVAICLSRGPGSPPGSDYRYRYAGRANRRTGIMTHVRLTSIRPYLFLALSLSLGPVSAKAQQPPDCTAAPYDVPAGLPTASITAAQDQAQMMCQQKLLFPTPTSNPPLSATRVSDPYKPVNAFPGTPATPETSNWTDALGHTIVRWGWGQWTTYDDSQSGGVADVLCNGAANCTKAMEVGTSTGGAMSGFGDYGPRGARPYPTGDAPLGIGGTVPCVAPGCLVAASYTPLDLLTLEKDHQKPSDWLYEPIDLLTMNSSGEKINTPEDWW